MKKLLLLLITIPFIGFGQETGCVSGDCVNGYGTLTFADGKITGEWKEFISSFCRRQQKYQLKKMVRDRELQ